MSLIEAEADRGLVVKIDEAVAGTTYFGFSKTSSNTALAVWSIKRMVEAAGVTTITRADGNGQYDNVWDNRASLSYS